MASIRFETSLYKWTHGKEPRGRGLWVYEIQRTSDGKTEKYWVHGSYTETKTKVRSLIRTLQQDSAWVVTVMP